MRIKSALIFILIFMWGSLSFAQKKDCSCPKVTCGPCQKKVTIGKIVKFCDWGDINVCRKVVCENVNFYFGCISNMQKKLKENAKKGEDLELAYEQEGGDKPKKGKKRRPASVRTGKRSEKVQLVTEGRIEVGNESRHIASKEYSTVVAGELQKFDKGIELVHQGQSTQPKKGRKLFVEDELFNKTDKTKKLTFKFASGEVELKLAKKSRLIMQDPHSILGRFQPFAYLVHGGVEMNLNMKEGSFDLLAGQILTRASHGRHKVNYEMGIEGLKVKVESLQASIEVIRAEDLSGKKITVDAGNFISWISETPSHLFTADEKSALAGLGFITPIFQMTDAQKTAYGMTEQKKSLFDDWSEKPPVTSMPAGRGLASNEVPNAMSLCQAPAGKFQQCAWSCQGNKKGSKECSADKPGIHCVRRICNAAGQWGVPTAFASSYSDLCPAEGVRVGSCSP